MKTTFHKYTIKKLGDRIKVPKCALDESRGYDYGTIVFEDDRNISVRWDDMQNPPFQITRSYVSKGKELLTHTTHEYVLPA